MDLKNPIFRESSQKKYRKKRQNDGFVRFELQVRARSKERFEQMVSSLADEYDHPWDIRRRKAMARADVFDEITEGIQHEFLELQRTIASLKQEVAALAPNFFIRDPNKTPLPSTIESLPNDPNHLKAVLAKVFKEAQLAKREAKESARKAEQFENLYDAAYQENESLEKRIQELESSDHTIG